MFSLRYVTNITFTFNTQRTQNQIRSHFPFIFPTYYSQVYLQKNDKKVSKKKTNLKKRADSIAIAFNESMIFSVPPYMLNAIQIRLTVVSCCSSDAYMQTDTSGTISNAKSIGHVIVGCQTSDKGSRHWNQMLSSLRKPVAMWHAIQKAQHIQPKKSK